MTKEEKTRLNSNEWEIVEVKRTFTFDVGMRWDHKKHITESHYMRFINDNEFSLLIFPHRLIVEEYKVRIVGK